MRKFISLLFSGALLATTLVGLTATPASAATTLTTCTDLSNQKIKVLSATKKNCNPFLGSAIWHIQQSDSSAHAGSGFATIRICSSKNPLFSYQFIEASCPKHQVTTEYWRTVSASQTPRIATAYARGHDSAIITLVTSNVEANLDAPISYYLVTDSKRGVTTRVLPGNLGQLNIAGLSPESTYTFTIAAVSVDGISEYSQKTPSIRTGTAPVIKAVSTVPLTCATGGTCIVGDTGPGGGKIFYVATTTFACGPTRAATCTYLEVAPALWNAGVADPTRIWPDISRTTRAVGSSGSPETATATAIGMGYRNTRAILLQGNIASATEVAAALADSYTVTVSGVVYDDWYLPSKGELNQMCKWARGVDLIPDATVCTGGTLNSAIHGASSAGFVNNYYWSSSENWSFSAWSQNFNNGDPYDRVKSSSAYIRPIRAF